MAKGDLTWDALVLWKLMDRPKKISELVDEIDPLKPKSKRESSRTSTHKNLKKLIHKGIVKKLNDRRYALAQYEEGIEDKVIEYLNEWDKRYPDLWTAPPPKEIMLEVGLNPEDKEDREKVIERMREEGYRYPLSISDEARRKHTEDLKSAMEDWMEKLSKDLTLVDIVEEVEENPLFSDLRIHLYDTLFDEWEDFKRIYEKYQDVHQKIVSKIEDEIEEKKKNGIPVSEFFTEDPSLVLTRKLMGMWETLGKNELHLQIQSWMRLPDDLADEDAEEAERTISAVGEVCKEIRDEYSQEFEDLNNLYRTINRLRGDMKGELEKCLHLTIFPGYCEYLVGEPSYSESSTGRR